MNTIRHAWVVVALVTAVTSGCGASDTSTADAQDVPPKPLDGRFSYDGYDALLKRFVDDEGMVDYAGLKANRESLDAFIASLNALPRETFDAWPKDEQLAFWINAYNAITLQRIIDHYPIRKGGFIAGLRFPENSIRQIAGVWDTVTTPVLGKPLTLDNIEHDIVRVDFTEPRIHAALVCAAMGCPPLRNEAYRAEKLDAQLEDNSRAYFAHDEKFRIDRESNRVYLSSILKWYGDDFVGTYNTGGEITGYGETNGAVLDYVARHVAPDDAEYLRTARYRVEFLDYDWSLNEQTR